MPLWLIILLILSPIFLFIIGVTEPRIRYLGLFLQIVGLVIVAQGLLNIWSKFDRPGLWATIKEGWARGPWHVRTRYVELAGTSNSMSSGAGYITTGVRPDASPEERLAALEENVNQLHKDFANLAGRFDTEGAKLHEVIKQEQDQRESTDEDIKSTLEDLAVGGLHLEAVGLVYLIFGLILATIPGEIASWIFGA